MAQPTENVWEFIIERVFSEARTQQTASSVEQWASRVPISTIIFQAECAATWKYVKLYVPRRKSRATLHV